MEGKLPTVAEIEETLQTLDKMGDPGGQVAYLQKIETAISLEKMKVLLRSSSFSSALSSFSRDPRIRDYELDVLRRFVANKKEEAEKRVKDLLDAEKTKRLKEIDECRYEQSDERRRTPRESLQSPQEESGETKEEWQARKTEKVRQVRARMQRSAKAKWDRKSPEEKRRAIKLAAQYQKWSETKDAPLPQDENHGVHTEWFDHIFIPPGIIRADTWVGFDSDLLIERLEATRSEYRAILDTQGIEELLQRKRDLEAQLLSRDQAIKKNKERSEEIIYRRYPNPEDSQSRRLEILAVNSIGSAFAAPKDEAEEELAQLSKQQQANIEDQWTLRFRLSVLSNVLERARRGLPQSWEYLYDRFRVDPEELQRAYAEAGVPEEGEPEKGVPEGESPHPLADKPKPYRRAYNVGEMLDGIERAEWPSTMQEIETLYAEKYGEPSSHRALRMSLESRSVKGESFYVTLKRNATDAERKQNTERTLRLCHEYYKRERERERE